LFSGAFRSFPFAAAGPILERFHKDLAQRKSEIGGASARWSSFSTIMLMNLWQMLRRL
jgi:hypothetical protein